MGWKRGIYVGRMRYDFKVVTLTRKNKAKQIEVVFTQAEW